MSATRPLPPKKAVALELLQGPSMFVHLDPRRERVVVPPWFKAQPQLVLQLGLNMAIAIRDLDVTDEGVSGTLSFNRSPFWCFVPWSAVYALVGDDGRGMVYPDDVPAELGAARSRTQDRSPAPSGAAEPGKRTRSRRKADAATGATPTPRGPRRKRPEDRAQASAESQQEPATPTSLDDARQARRLARQPRRRATDWAPEQPALSPPKRASDGRAARPGASASAVGSGSGDTTRAVDDGKPGRQLPPYLRVVK